MTNIIQTIFPEAELLDSKGNNFKINNIEFSSLKKDSDYFILYLCEGEYIENKDFEKTVNKKFSINKFSENAFVYIQKFILKFTENEVFQYNTYSNFLTILKNKNNYFNYLKFYTNNYRQVITQNLFFYNNSFVPIIQFILFKDEEEFNFNFFEFENKIFSYNLKDNNIIPINNFVDILKSNKKFLKINELKKLTFENNLDLNEEEKQYLDLLIVDLY
jgi:hypothetical protein